MLASDTLAALCTVVVLVLLKTDNLQIWHLYCLNALNGLMNTVQQPTADVTTSLLIPQKHYQKASGMRSLSGSLVSIVTPVFATALLTLVGIEAVILFDLVTFSVAFLSLLFFIRIPEMKQDSDAKETLWQSARSGLRYLKENRGLLDLILFLAAINLIASIYNAAFPAMILSKAAGGQVALGIINTATGLALLVGSVIASVLPAPKSRVRVICNALLLSMSTENIILALGRSLPIWCIGSVLGWLCIPIMNANMDVVFRSHIPIPMQGRVFASRNTLQFFTIPIGYALGGVLVDKVFEPFMATQTADSIFAMAFGVGKGSGAAFLFFVIAFIGVLICLIFRRDKHIWALEK